MFSSVAHAMGSSGAAGGESALLNFAPLIIMLGIFYFLLIRPQQKRAREHKAMLGALKKGDSVITNAGFIGRIVDLDDETLTIDLGETKVLLGRGYVAGKTEIRAKNDKTQDKKDKKDKTAKVEDKPEKLEEKPEIVEEKVEDKVDTDAAASKSSEKTEA